MKLVKIQHESNLINIKNGKKKFCEKINLILINYSIIFILFIINEIIIIYLLIEFKKLSTIIKEILDINNDFDFKNKKNYNIQNEFPINDKEMIGLYYPEINFDKIRKKLQNFNIVESLNDLINQIEIKLIFLEKEINIYEK